MDEVVGELGVVATLRERMVDEIERRGAMGYRFAMVYVTPTELEGEVADPTLGGLEVDGAAVTPCLWRDNVKRERGDPDHMLFMAQWGDPFGLEAMRAAGVARRAAEAAKAAAKAARAERVAAGGTGARTTAGAGVKGTGAKKTKTKETKAKGAKAKATGAKASRRGSKAKGSTRAGGDAGGDLAGGGASPKAVAKAVVAGPRA